MRNLEKLISALVDSDETEGIKTKFYTIKDVAQRYCVHENTIRNWQKRKLLKASINIPGARSIVRFSEQDLFDFEKKCREREA